jgi:hypothetical protein
MIPTKLSRPKLARHVVFTTVKWLDSKLPEQKRREEQLRTNVWMEMIKGGAHLCQFRKTKASAWSVVDTILKNQPTEMLFIRKELDRIYRKHRQKYKGGFSTYLCGVA